jgi:CHAT domain-containing protein
MQFSDPALQYSFRLPLGWAYDWERSHLITVIFRRWERRDESMSVRAMPTFAPPDASLDDWHAALENRAFPPRMRPATRISAGSSPAALVESHDHDPDPVHRRIMIVRGTRLDVAVEHRTPEPSTGPRQSEVLRIIGESLEVPTNRFLPEAVEQDVVMQDLDLAAEAIRREAWKDALDPALRALKAAQSMYLYTMVKNTPLPEIPAVLAQINAAFKLAQATGSNATGSILFLRDAEQLAMRALYTLEHLPFVNPQRRRQLRDDLFQGLEAIAGLQCSFAPSNGNSSAIQPSPGLGLAHLRSDHLERQARETLALGVPDVALMLCEAMIADLLMVVSELPQRYEAFSAERLHPGLAEQFRASGAATPEQMRELALNLITRTKLDDLTRALQLLADLRLLTDDFVGASEATEFLLPILDRLGQPLELSFGGHLEPPHNTPAQRVQALIAYASSLADVGDPPSLEEARHVLDEAEELLNDMHEEGAMRAHLCLVRASVLHSERRLEGALEIIERGLRAAANDPQTAAATVLELKTIRSQFLLNAGDVEEARRVALEVISMPEGNTPRAIQRRSSHYLNLAIIDIRISDFEGAAESLRQALDKVVQVAPFSEAAYRILIVSSRLFTDRFDGQRNLALAHRLNLAALANLDARYARISSDSARIGFDETGLHRQSYEELIERLIAEHAWDEAATIADRSRARSLLRLIAPPTGEGNALQSAPQPPPRLQEMELKEAFYEASDYVIARADAQINQQGVFRPLGTKDLKDVARAIGSSCLVIQPVDGRVALIVVRPDGEVRGTYSPNSYSELLIAFQMVSDQIELARLAPAPNSAQEPVGTNQVLDEWLHTLWLGLIAPVSDLIGQDEPLVIVPYREFTLVPFALLRDQSGTSLIEHRPIAVTPSLATLRALRAKGRWERSRPVKAYVAGDPAFNSGFRLRRLPAARAEAETVASMLRSVMIQDGELLLRVDSEAHEESYRREARGCDLVHLSCHAQLAEPAYMSRLVLGPYGQQDGLLMAAEITDVKLNDALVFLGACQTGQGRVTADGVVGLGRAFLEAGARTVVLSLWSVQDEATYALTTHFYQSLLDADVQPSAAKALQQAMLKTRDDLRAGRIVVKDKALEDRLPYWAPFFILGDAFTVRYAAGG